MPTSPELHNARVERELKLQLGELHVRLAVALAENQGLQDELAALRPPPPPPRPAP
jgi:hypothetical protein